MLKSSARRGLRARILWRMDAIGIIRRQETVSERLVFSEKPEQEMFGLNAVGAELAGFVAGEKDDRGGLFRYIART